MSALISFLGGSAFRAVWGELSAAWTKHQDHKHELALMEVQAKLDAQRHAQQQDAIKLQAELGIKVIEVRAEAHASAAEDDAWLDAVKSINRPTGHKWLDIARMSVQPLLGYIAIIIWVAALNEQGWKVTDWDKELVSAIFGMYLANRQLNARGK